MVNKGPRKEGRSRHDSASHGGVTVRRVFPCGPGNMAPDQLHALRRYSLSPEAVVHALRVLISTAPLSLVQFGGIICPCPLSVNRKVKNLGGFPQKGGIGRESHSTLPRRGFGLFCRKTRKIGKDGAAEPWHCLRYGITLGRTDKRQICDTGKRLIAPASAAQADVLRGSRTPERRMR